MSLSPPRSREATPSTASASSQSVLSHHALEGGTSSSMSGGESSQGQAQPTAPQAGQAGHAGKGDEADKFRRRLELEQTMQVLQQRLELANIKAKNGWSGMSINEIETRLPPTPPRRRREDMRIVTGQRGEASGSASAAGAASAPSSATSLPSVPGVATGGYEPPSPSRPWQLVDVLWQPLPPPSRGYPASPGSPLKRSRPDDEWRPPRAPRDTNGHARRASGSNHPISPAEQVKRREKKRSQSHSHARLPPTTTQDFNAARALTEMLGSGSPSSVSPASFRRASAAAGGASASSQHHHHLPSSSSHAASLPLPPAFDHEPRRRASATPPGRSPRAPPPRHHPRPPPPPRPQPDEEDTNAAELMMFLAHSPSPASTQPRRPDPDPPARAFAGAGGAARVLFAEDGPGRVEKHSNLGLAPPITANGDDTRFGALL